MAEDQNFASDYHKHERVLIPNSSDIIGEEASGSAKEITDSDAISFSSESLPSSMDLSDSSQGFTQPRKVGRQTPSVLQTNSEPGSLPTSPTQNDSDIGIILDQLPSEIILHICSFIDARFVVCTLSRVCQFFHHLLNDRIFWKVRIRKRWPKKYPAIPVNNAEFNWKAACVAREEQYNLWSQCEHTMNYFRFTEGIFAPVDCVHLMQLCGNSSVHFSAAYGNMEWINQKLKQHGKLLAVGSRDRYLNVLDLSRLDPDNPITSVKESKVFSKFDAHTGWIWSLASLDGLLATGSWDTFIKFWDMEAGGQELRKVKCKSAVLAMHYEPHFLVGCGFDKKVYHIDPRAATVLAEKRYHKKAVLCVKADDKYILTGSEDSTVVVYDRRADKIFDTLKFPSFPMCLSYDEDQLWIGDKEGLVHLVDATDGDFDIVETYNVGHQGKITGIHHTLGALYTCSTDRTIRIHEPGVDPGLITTLNQQKAEVASIDFCDDILVSGCSDVSVGIWKSKRRQDT